MNVEIKPACKRLMFLEKCYNRLMPSQKTPVIFVYIQFYVFYGNCGSLNENGPHSHILEGLVPVVPVVVGAIWKGGGECFEGFKSP